MDELNIGKDGKIKGLSEYLEKEAGALKEASKQSRKKKNANYNETRGIRSKMKDIAKDNGGDKEAAALQLIAKNSKARKEREERNAAVVQAVVQANTAAVKQHLDESQKAQEKDDKETEWLQGFLEMQYTRSQGGQRLVTPGPTPTHSRAPSLRT